MNANIPFYLYIVLTYVVTTYILVDKFIQEGQLVTFSLYMFKSKSYLSMLMNLVIATYFLCGKFLLWLFFSNLRTSEFAGVADKLKMKIFSMFILFMTMRPTIDISRILMILHVYFVILVNMLSFNRAAYLIKADGENRRAQIKILFLYVFLFFVNHISYIVVSHPLKAVGIDLLSLSFDINISSGFTGNDSLIYCIFSSELLFIQFKLFIKFMKLSVEMTELQLKKHWEYNQLSLSILNLFRYFFKVLLEIKFCYIITKTGVFPVFIIIDVFYSVWHLFKQFSKIYEYITLNRLISQLNDYVEDPTDNIAHSNNCICLEEVKVGKKLPCGHVFHLHCIK